MYIKTPRSRSQGAGLIVRLSAQEEATYPQVVETLRSQASHIRKIPNAESSLKDDTEITLRAHYRDLKYSRFLAYISQMDCRLFIFFENVCAGKPDVLCGRIAYTALATFYAYRSGGKVKRPEILELEGGSVDDIAISFRPRVQGRKSVMKFYYPHRPGSLLGPQGRHIQPVRQWLQGTFPLCLVKVEEKPGVKCPDSLPGSA